MASFCSTKFLFLLFVISAVPIAVFIALECSTPSTHTYVVHSTSWFRESLKWDHRNRRFLVSQMTNAAIGEIGVPDSHLPSSSRIDAVEEITVVKHGGGFSNASLGLLVDEPRNRLLMAVGDVIQNRYSWLVAYDLTTWEPLFRTQLAGPEDEKSLADDVAVDEEGNSYVTDAKASKIWKVSENGDLVSVIRSPLFNFKEWYKNQVALNGIVHHPDGFLLVVHTCTGTLYRVEVKEGSEEVKVVKIVEGSLLFGDGLLLLSPTKLVVVGNPAVKLVESSDGWRTAAVVGRFYGRMHRIATSATVKDGRVYVGHLIGTLRGLGFGGSSKNKHVIVEAAFSS